MNKSPLKIAIIGSAGDLGYSQKAEDLAQQIGKEIAIRKHILLYGPEKSVPSLSYQAAKSAKASGGTTIGIAIGSARTKFYDESACTVSIYTDAAGGFGREVVLVNSADVMIAFGGGAGTLIELSIAYANHTPIVAIEGIEGWSSSLIGKHVDGRNKGEIIGAKTAIEAVDVAEILAEKFAGKLSHLDNFIEQKKN